MNIKNSIIALIVILSIVSCGNKNTETSEQKTEESTEKGLVVLSSEHQKALNLEIGNFQMRNLTTVVKINGQLEVAPKNKADITAIVGGNVNQIKVFMGDKVVRGQVLAVLEHPDYIKLQEKFSEIANNLEYLQQEYNRQKELYENKVGAGKDFQKAKSEYFTAIAKYKGLEARLKLLNISPEKVKKGQISSKINIISPISGFVTDIDIKLGTYVDAQDKMFEITDNSKLHAGFLVYEKDVHLLKIGQKIHFTVANRPKEEFTAYIFAIDEKFDANTRAIHIHAQINESIKGLIPGMYISGHLHTDKKLSKTLPNDAIVKEGTKSFIFIVDKEDTDKLKNTNEGEKTVFKMIEVVQGTKDDGYTQIRLIDSIPENAKVVLNKAYYLLADMNKDEMGDDD